MLAHLAMAGPIRSADPEESTEAMLLRIRTGWTRAMDDLIEPLVEVAAQYLNVPEPLRRPIAERVVRRLTRAGRRARAARRDALAWFGHQDQDFHHDPLRALVRLSVQAQDDDAAVRRDVDDLLMTALLADLRESFARARNHRANAVLLLDNGDAAAASAFVRTLVRVRREPARHRGPARDPLTVITTSGGSLAGDADEQRPRWSEATLPALTRDDIARAGPWLRVLLSGLTLDDVQHIARRYDWPATMGTRTIATAVHRLTGGHAEATELVVDRLRAEPRFIDDLGGALATPGPDPGRAVEEHLIDRITADLGPRRPVASHLRDDLITLAAARDKLEARRLVPLLREPFDAEPALFGSTTLWSGTAPRKSPALAPFVRYVLLRALAARPAGHPAAWAKVFSLLRSCAAGDDEDVAGRLHHDLALGAVDGVVDELHRLLASLSGQRWLAVLDQAVAIPLLRPSNAVPRPGGDAAPATATPSSDDRRHVAGLVAALHALADPGLSERGTLRRRRLAVSHHYRQLSDKDQAPFLDRAQHYQRLADGLA